MTTNDALVVYKFIQKFGGSCVAVAGRASLIREGLLPNGELKDVDIICIGANDIVENLRIVISAADLDVQVDRYDPDYEFSRNQQKSIREGNVPLDSACKITFMKANKAKSSAIEKTTSSTAKVSYHIDQKVWPSSFLEQEYYQNIGIDPRPEIHTPKVDITSSEIQSAYESFSALPTQREDYALSRINKFSEYKEKNSELISQFADIVKRGNGEINVDVFQYGECNIPDHFSYDPQNDTLWGLGTDALKAKVSYCLNPDAEEAIVAKHLRDIITAFVIADPEGLNLHPLIQFIRQVRSISNENYTIILQTSDSAIKRGGIELSHEIVERYRRLSSDI